MGIYSNKNFCNNFLDLSQIPEPLIYANPEASASGHKCDTWQYSWIGSLPGVRGHVDMDVSYTDFSATTPVVSKTYCDTTMDFKIPLGGSYKIKTGSNLVTLGNSAVIKTAGQIKQSDGSYLTTLTAVGHTGQSTSVYLAGVRVVMVTIG